MDKRRKPAIREPRPEITLEEMRAILENITEIESATGIRYIKLHVTAKMIIGIRESSGKEFTINLNDLYRAYQECLRFTSPEVKKYTSNPQPIGFSGILLAKRQNSFYCTYFLHNRNVADTKSPYPIKRLEVIRWFNQKSMVFNQSLS